MSTPNLRPRSKRRWPWRAGWTAGNSRPPSGATQFVTDLSKNAAIEDYGGHDDWLVTVGRVEGTQLACSGRAGRRFKRFTTHPDRSIPVRIRLFDFATYFIPQYFNGCGGFSFGR